VWVAMLATTGFGLIGMWDDWLKIKKRRGLSARLKFLLQAVLTLVLLQIVFWQPRPDWQPVLAIPFFKGWLVDLGWWWFAFALVVVVGASNAVNLTDGLDGLACGSSAMVFAAYTLVNIWQNNQFCGTHPGPKCYEVRDPLDLAVVAAALTGACFGFLWWNAAPAKIIMGDTGSLSLGGAMAGLAIMTRTDLLLLIIGGLFVIISLSVMLQVGWFKLSKGKRLFRMAPLHHHFELAGWAEITVVIRFWIISGLCVATGLGVFYAEWVAGA
jgi:phospho-N-acetylmuramoyl-pentapeptide-transferase